MSASSRVLSGYALGGSFGIGDYFAESDGDDGDGGDEADDEFDALTTASQPPPPLLSSRQRLEANGREQTAARPSLLLAVPQQAVRNIIYDPTHLTYFHPIFNQQNQDVMFSCETISIRNF